MIKPNKYIQSLEPYNITSQDVWSEMAGNDILKLDWNEAPEEFRFYTNELKKILTGRGMVAWYSDYLALDITDALSDFLGVDPNLILTFPGSDVALETLCRAYLNPDDLVVALCPTYENFFVYASQTGAVLKKLVLDKPFDFNREAVFTDLVAFGDIKMVYLVNPNNPCGYLISSDDIYYLADRFPSTIFVIDEAYIEFASGVSSVSGLDRFCNIVILRTFSKAFGMAGVRLGYMCAPKEIILTVNKIRNGKNVSMIAQKLGIFALKNINLIYDWITEVQESRAIFEKWCGENNVVFYRSEGNFILFEAREPISLCSELKARGIYIRNRHAIIPNCVRVTLGSKSNTYRLIAELEALNGVL